jgi:succinate dehydrogenase / fumarate reductase cytochrome b subunit
LRKNAARPTSYAKQRHTISTYASRTMYWSGPIVLAFIIYHLLHFTFGTVHPDFRPGDVYHNLVTGFQQPVVSAAYIVSMAFLCLHLYHGLWSVFQSLGASHPRYTPVLQLGAKGIALLIFLGNISIPISVLAGVVHA